MPIVKPYFWHRYSLFAWFSQIVVILMNLYRCKLGISSRLQAAKRLKERLSIDNILWWKEKSHWQDHWVFVTFTFDADNSESRETKPRVTASLWDFDILIWFWLLFNIDNKESFCKILNKVANLNNRDLFFRAATFCEKGI